MVEVTVHNTYGALIVGIVIAIFLFGIITLQTVEYLTSFRDDRLGFKLMVVGLWFLELGHAMGIASELYIAALPKSGSQRYTGLAAALLLGGLSTLVVQGFFSRRIWKLLSHPYNFIGPLCFLLALIRAIGTVFLSVQGIKSGNLILIRARYGWLITGLLALGVGADLVIAITMVSFLLSQKNEGFGRFGRIVDRLVAYTIRTGVLTSITAVAALICFQTMPWTFIWMGIFCILEKLYTSSLLSSLMERQILRSAVQTSSLPGSRPLPSSTVRRQGTNKTSSGGVVSSLSVGQMTSEPILIEMHTASNSKNGHTLSEHLVQPEAMNYPWQSSFEKVG